MWQENFSLRDSSAEYYLNKLDEKLGQKKDLAFIVSDPYKDIAEKGVM